MNVMGFICVSEDVWRHIGSSETEQMDSCDNISSNEVKILWSCISAVPYEVTG